MIARLTTEPAQEDPSGSEGEATKLADEDMLSLFDDGRTRHLPLEARPSWTGGEVDETSADPLVGTTLHETYSIVRVIGQGGMGRVYEAQHTRIASKRFAIKVLHQEFAKDPEIRRRFQHEAEAAAKVEHAGVVGTYDIGETADGACYLVCEYLSGEDLNDYLTKRGALPARAVVHIGKQLCAALGAAHARGVIHRDLKPHNVFVLGEEAADRTDSLPSDSLELPSVKVLDFGLSRFIERDTDLTKAGIILGTPGYMAPEQAGGIDTDVRTDIYGIGALLYALATGRAPFKEDTPQKTVLSVLSQVPARPRDLVASIPIPLEIVIQRAMARAPDERYQSAGEMENAFEQLDASSTGWDRRARRATDPTAPRLQFLLWSFAAMILGVPALGLALISVLATRGIDTRTFRPSVLEWLLFALLSLVSLFLAGALLRRFQRRVWKDSARVADLLPLIQRPLMAATFAYGVSALVASAAWGIQGVGASSLASGPQISSLLWFVVLPLNALLAASAALILEFSRKAEGPFTRALLGVGYSAGAAVAGVFLLILALATPASLVPQAPSHSRAVGPIIEAKSESTPTEPVAVEPAKAAAPVSVKKTADAEPSDAPKTVEQNVPRKRAPAQELAAAQSRGPEELERLSEQYPRDGKVLVALVLAHASRADTLNLSLRAISRLFVVEPEFATTSDVLFILKKGLLSQGETHSIAFDVVKNRMGEAGGELVYQMLSDHPKQQTRLKNVFFELRKADQVSAATSIAYDLRYAPSCHARLALLGRAEKDGDQRSEQLLLGLSTVPKSCSWYRKCQAQCPSEAARFRESVDALRSRLAEGK